MKRFWIKLNGMSMSPLLVNQDDILIEKMSIDDVGAGDIVLFIDHSSKELTLHRYIGKPFITKGDLSLIDEVNLAESLIGRAIGFERNDYYRSIPKRNSLITKTFLVLSSLRMNGAVLRKVAKVLQIILTKAFLIYSDKTKLNHNKELLINDL